MKTDSKISKIQLLVAAVLSSLLMIATSQAQDDLAAFKGKFRLDKQVLWGDTLLPPGNYIVTVASGANPTSASVRDSNGRTVARFMSGVESGTVSTGNALLLTDKHGQLRVYSLALPSLGKELVYEQTLARNATLEARERQKVPIIVAKP